MPPALTRRIRERGHRQALTQPRRGLRLGYGGTGVKGVAERWSSSNGQSDPGIAPSRSTPARAPESALDRGRSRIEARGCQLHGRLRAPSSRLANSGRQQGRRARRGEVRPPALPQPPPVAPPQVPGLPAEPVAAPSPARRGARTPEGGRVGAAGRVDRGDHQWDTRERVSIAPQFSPRPDERRPRRGASRDLVVANQPASMAAGGCRGHLASGQGGQRTTGPRMFTTTTSACGTRTVGQVRGSARATRHTPVPGMSGPCARPNEGRLLHPGHARCRRAGGVHPLDRSGGGGASSSRGPRGSDRYRPGRPRQRVTEKGKGATCGAESPTVVRPSRRSRSERHSASGQ